MLETLPKSLSFMIAVDACVAWQQTTTWSIWDIAFVLWFYCGRYRKSTDSRRRRTKTSPSRRQPRIISHMIVTPYHTSHSAWEHFMTLTSHHIQRCSGQGMHTTSCKRHSCIVHHQMYLVTKWWVPMHGRCGCNLSWHGVWCNSFSMAHHQADLDWIRKFYADDFADPRLQLAVAGGVVLKRSRPKQWRLSVLRPCRI